jgi:hypothetical protein
MEENKKKPEQRPAAAFLSSFLFSGCLPDPQFVFRCPRSLPFTPRAWFLMLQTAQLPFCYTSLSPKILEKI